MRSLFRELADLSLGDREKVFAGRRIAPELRAEVESLLQFDSANHCLTGSISSAAEHGKGVASVGAIQEAFAIAARLAAGLQSQDHLEGLGAGDMT